MSEVHCACALVLILFHVPRICYRATKFNANKAVPGEHFLLLSLSKFLIRWNFVTVTGHAEVLRKEDK